jgi:hypothetical protein
MDLGGWLRSLGLEKYEAVLRDNEIDDAVLHNLTEDHRCSEPPPPRNLASIDMAAAWVQAI